MNAWVYHKARNTPSRKRSAGCPRTCTTDMSRRCDSASALERGDGAEFLDELGSRCVHNFCFYSR